MGTGGRRRRIELEAWKENKVTAVVGPVSSHCVAPGYRRQLIRTGVEGHNHDLDLPLYMHELKKTRIRGISWFFFILTAFNKAKITI